LINYGSIQRTARKAPRPHPLAGVFLIYKYQIFRTDDVRFDTNLSKSGQPGHPNEANLATDLASPLACPPKERCRGSIAESLLSGRRISGWFGSQFSRDRVLV